ncbi:MAG: hypothetical protein P8M80_11710 [Pirellulaceae bacterium]|nr:hypothetical protein [Pirellulaceae bacterium]
MDQLQSPVMRYPPGMEVLQQSSVPQPIGNSVPSVTLSRESFTLTLAMTQSVLINAYQQSQIEVKVASSSQR